MKIALVHKRLDLKGGTERDLFKTTEGLRDLGHEVHLFCGDYHVPAPRGALAHRVAVAPLGRTARLWSFAVNARKSIRESHCDVVVNFGRMFESDILRCGGGTHRGFLRRMGKAGGRRRRFWQSVSLYHRSLLALEKRQFECARRFIAVSAGVKADIMDNYPVADGKITVLYNGVDHHRFHPARRAEYRRSIRQRWKIPMDAPLVLFVGSGFRRKGLERMIPLWSSRKFADVYLLIVGTDARLARYRSWADAVAPDKIIFAGHQDAVENYYAAADLVALPSIQEAFGNVVLEALAAGLPVLVSREVGAAELLKGTLAAGIVDRADEPGELEAKFLSSVDQSADAALAREARQIGEEYSWENHFRKLEEILLETCEMPSLARVS